jgi:hypothetical protein
VYYTVGGVYYTAIKKQLDVSARTHGITPLSDGPDVLQNTTAKAIKIILEARRRVVII